jgi:hypothetical protein
LPDAITTGFGRFCVLIAGPSPALADGSPKAGLAAAAAKPAVLVATNSRREILSDMTRAPTVEVCGRAGRL